MARKCYLLKQIHLSYPRVYSFRLPNREHRASPWVASSWRKRRYRAWYKIFVQIFFQIFFPNLNFIYRKRKGRVKRLAWNVFRLCLHSPTPAFSLTYKDTLFKSLGEFNFPFSRISLLLDEIKLLKKKPIQRRF